MRFRGNGSLAAAKSLDEEAIQLAVVAHICHAETDYDHLLADGWERQEARMQVAPKISEVLERLK